MFVLIRPKNKFGSQNLSLEKKQSNELKKNTNQNNNKKMLVLVSYRNNRYPGCTNGDVNTTQPTLQIETVLMKIEK